MANLLNIQLALKLISAINTSDFRKKTELPVWPAILFRYTELVPEIPPEECLLY